MPNGSEQFIPWKGKCPKEQDEEDPSPAASIARLGGYAEGHGTGAGISEESFYCLEFFMPTHRNRFSLILATSYLEITLNAGLDFHTVCQPP